MNSLNINSTINNNLMSVKIVLIFSLLELGFSQPELQIHLVSFSVHCQHLTFHIFRDLLWNHLVNSNQTWHRTSFGKGHYLLYYEFVDVIALWCNNLITWLIPSSYWCKSVWQRFNVVKIYYSLITGVYNLFTENLIAV